MKEQEGRKEGGKGQRAISAMPSFVAKNSLSAFYGLSEKEEEEEVRLTTTTATPSSLPQPQDNAITQ